MKYNAPVNDMMFLVDRFIGVEKITALQGYEDLDRESIEFILEEAGRFCSNELLPINREGDERGATLDDDKVTTPPGFREAYERLVEGGWTGLDADPEFGGQGLPRLLQYLVDEMFAAANLAFKLYAELTHGACYLLAAYAPAAIREQWLPRMIAGTWSGTMCLTEPHCGTDLGLLTTRASPNDDGTWQINGSKIFITSGDHDLTENIVHLVLARADGAPAGTRGISLFAVPKFLVGEDGTVGPRNGVVTASIEHKMGIKGSATCALNFENAAGYLIGEENRGLAAMFRMMNTERITVGIQGIGFAEIARQNAVQYATERLQSRAPAPRPDGAKAADAIIFQPEIRRMLLRIQSQVEGARMLTAFAGYHVDLMDKAADDDIRAEAAAIVALFTPVIKAYCSDLGVESTLAAQQVYGGHGYIREHGMEQLVRDCRITQMYEGTNEVQAADLVLRKLTGDSGIAADRLFQSWRAELDALADDAIAASVSGALERLLTTTSWIRARLDNDQAAVCGAATGYLRLFALTSLGVFWVRSLALLDGDDSRFATTKRKVGVYFVNCVLPETVAIHDTIANGAPALAAFTAEDFAD